MKTAFCLVGRSSRSLLFGALFLLGFCVPVPAQSYAVNWHKVSGGGGTSGGAGGYSISGTIGQPDAGRQLTGVGYAVTGGFWALDAVQTPGLPLLHITALTPTSAFVWWLPGEGTYILQTNGVITSPNWVTYGGTITSSGGTNSVTIAPPKGNLFFRLENP
jgi:hypothetical protein